MFLAAPNPGAYVAVNIAAKPTINTRVKLVTNAHIGHAPPVSIKNILESIKPSPPITAQSHPHLPTTLAAILAKQCTEFPRFQ